MLEDIHPINFFDSYLKHEISIEALKTVEPGKIKMYSCGPTVYSTQHIGNMRAAWFPDTFRKVAELAGWEVELVHNITDVGHLTGDNIGNADTGEDRLEKGAKREGKSVQEIVNYYLHDYLYQAKMIGVDLPTGNYQPKATEYIKEQMVLALTLLKEGKAYLTEDGIYFDSENSTTNDNPSQDNSKDNNSNSALQSIIQTIQKLKIEKPDKPLIIAIDGRGGSGKSTLGKKIVELLDDAELVECDDFFDFENLDESSYFFDKTRFTKQVLIPLSQGKEALFEGNNRLDNKLYGKITKTIQPKKIIIVEGLCTLQSDLINYYDLSIWVENGLESSLARAKNRDITQKNAVEKYHDEFWAKWVPVQEKYINLEKPKEQADIIISTENNVYEILQSDSTDINNTNYTGRDIVQTEKRNSEDFAIWKFVDSNNLQKWKFADFPEAVWVYEQFKTKLTKNSPNLIDYTKANTSFLNADLALFIETSRNYENMMTTWGCPGWHSECVAMIVKILAKKEMDDFISNEENKKPYLIDVHSGGEEHIPIHHLNEIMQSEALGFHLSKNWLHWKHVLIDGGKMSKSLGTNYTVHDIIQRGFDPLAYRLLLMEHQYNEYMNFTWDKLEQSQNRLFNLRKEVAKIRSFAQSPNLEVLDEKKYLSIKNNWLEILANDLNIPKFLNEYQEYLYSTVNRIQENEIMAVQDHKILSEFASKLLRLKMFELDLPAEIVTIAENRWEAKKQKNYNVADEYRKEALTQGWQIDDYRWGWGIWWKGMNK